MRQFKPTVSYTKRDTKALDNYIRDIAHYPRLTPDEEIELISRIREGDEAALNRLVEGNLRFVVSVAKQYQNQGLQLIDIIEEGNIGLIKAAYKFDETRGFKFISYAVWWIRQSILQAITEKGRMVRLPSNQVGVLNLIKRVIAEFEQEYERMPSDEELSMITNLEAAKIGESLRNSPRHISVDAPLQEEGDGGMAETLTNVEDPGSDSSMMSESLRTEIDRVLSTLDHREEQVLRASFGIGIREMSLEEIGYQLSLPRERVRQIREKAIHKLRTTDKKQTLRTYLS